MEPKATSGEAGLFAEAAGVMCQIGRLPEQTVQEFKLLGVKAKAAATEARDKEALLGEIPGVP